MHWVFQPEPITTSQNQFEALYVRYLWPSVWPQYLPPETRPRLQNPLGLSWELESSSTYPQVAKITNSNYLPTMFWNEIMIQSPPCRKRNVFCDDLMSDSKSVKNCRTTHHDAISQLLLSLFLPDADLHEVEMYWFYINNLVVLSQ